MIVGTSDLFLKSFDQICAYDLVKYQFRSSPKKNGEILNQNNFFFHYLPKGQILYCLEKRFEKVSDKDNLIRVIFRHKHCSFEAESMKILA